MRRRSSASPPFIAYYRVSTGKQGQLGFGLEAQQAMVLAHVEASHGQLLAEFSETASGLKSDRPQLQKAIAWCRVYRATLVIARLDRLARSVDMIADILESGLDFVALDAPHANRFTLHILAALAEYESKLMSERMKAVRAVAKAHGAAPKGAEKRAQAQFPASAYVESAKIRRRKSEARASDLGPLVWAAIRQGKSFRVIADEFNRDGIAPPRSAPWSKNSIERLARRTRAEFGCADATCFERRLGFAQVRIESRTAAIGPMLVQFWRAGTSYACIREELRRRGIAAPWGGAWGQASIRRYLMRALDVPGLRQTRRTAE